MPAPLDPRLVEASIPDLALPARMGELDRRVSDLDRQRLSSPWAKPTGFGANGGVLVDGGFGGVAGTGQWLQYRDNYGADWEYVAWRKDPLGRVHLKGLAAWNSAGSSGINPVILRLPPAFRPNRHQMFVIRVFRNGTEGDALTHATIRGAVTGGATAGDLIVAGAAFTQAGAWVELAGISFDATDGTAT